MRQNRPFIRQPGEKWQIRAWICEQFPEGYENLTYCEPFGGCASVLFHKKQSKIEVFNDMDEPLVNLLRALRDEPGELSKRLSRQTDSKDTFDRLAKRKTADDYMDSAVQDFVLRKISKNHQKSEYQKLRAGDDWKNHVSLIPELSKRIRDAFLCNKKATEIIQTINCESVLIYCDPPYLHDLKGKSLYGSEMSMEEHMELYRLLNNFSGKVVLSGCMSPLYKRLYKNWNMQKKKIHNGKNVPEIVWKNF